jgi:hypothetical protein
MPGDTPQLQTSFTHNWLMAAITMAQQYAAECIHQTAVNAANVQVIANNIVRMAAEAGNILSVVNAAYAESDIAVNTKNAYTLINKTAFTAELASLLAMECSMQAASLSETGILQQLTTTSTDNNPPADLQTALVAAVTKAEEITGKTTMLTQQIKIMAFQFISAAGAAQLLQKLVVTKRALNPLIAEELVQLATTLGAAAAHIAALLPVTIQSTLAADAAALQTATIYGWMNESNALLS